MDWEEHQQEYARRGKALDETIEEQKIQRQALKQIENVEETAARLQKETLLFLEGLEADFRDAQMGKFARNQMDVIRADHRDARQNRKKTAEILRQNLKHLKQQEEEQEQSKQDLRKEKEGSDYGDQTQRQ